MKQTLNQMKAALSRGGIPATVLQMGLPGGQQVTIAMAVTEAPYGDPHVTVRQPDHAEMKRALHTLSQWAGQVDVE